MRQTDRQTDERIAALRDAICWAGHKIQLPIRVFFDDIMTITCSAAMILLCYALSRFERIKRISLERYYNLYSSYVYV